MEIGRITKDGEGIKLNYTKLKKAINKCEYEAEQGRINNQCKAIFKDMGIDVID